MTLAIRVAQVVWLRGQESNLCLEIQSLAAYQLADPAPSDHFLNPRSNAVRKIYTSPN